MSSLATSQNQLGLAPCTQAPHQGCQGNKLCNQSAIQVSSINSAGVQVSRCLWSKPSEGVTVFGVGGFFRFQLCPSLHISQRVKDFFLRTLVFLNCGKYKMITGCAISQQEFHVLMQGCVCSSESPVMMLGLMMKCLALWRRAWC